MTGSIGSLFSGIGGLEMGLEMCGLGPVIWQAERDPFASAVLAKHWPEVQRYDDVRDIDERAARPDIICGGFPCQDISNAGSRAGIDGERSGLWSEYARIVRVVRPRFVFVENVAALVARGLDRVLGDLATLGFNAEWGVFRASDIGAPHRRERLFILAHSRCERLNARQPQPIAGCSTEAKPGAAGQAMADADGERRPQPQRGKRDERRRIGHRRQEDVVDTRSERGDTWLEGAEDGDGRGHRFPPGPDGIAGWDGPQPAVRRSADGLPGRVDRLRCLGNAVVPQVAALAWRTLSARAVAS